ncbi:MAG: alpha/beta hydrolase [Asgard group archaeon]|nr:alpha/beta hydrolase [Asgard group archaeon]
MDIIAITFLVIALLLFVLFVLISATIIGLWLTEIGLWISCLPLLMIPASIIMLTNNWMLPQQTMNNIFLITSSILNAVTFLRLFIPFIRLRKSNWQLQRSIMQGLGEDYLHYVDPFISSRFSKDVRFRLTHYFTGVRTRALSKRVSSVKGKIYKTVDKQELKLNIYYPNREGIFPTIVFIHGGGFLIGSKDRPKCEKICKMLANYGYVIFSVDYRLAPLKYLTKNKASIKEDLLICDMVADVRSSIIYTKKNAHLYNGDPNELFLFGRSAGGHLALLTTFSCLGQFHEIDETDGSIQQYKIAGVIAFYPVTDFSKLYNFYGIQNLLQALVYHGTEDTPEELQYLYELFSPITYVTKKYRDSIPPVFLVTGGKDKLVAPDQSMMLFKKLQKLKLDSVLLDLPWANHGFDTILNGPGGQLTLKYLSQFLVWVITKRKLEKINDLAKEHGMGDVVSKEKYRVLHDLKKMNIDQERDMNKYLPFIEYVYQEETKSDI